MHRGGQYVTTISGGAPTKASVKQLVLSAHQAALLSRALNDDAQDYYYSACLSFVDALRGLQSGFYSWATVKCYYSVFYAARAILARDGYCIFYMQNTPFGVSAAPGEIPVKRAGRTHDTVLNAFAAENPNHKLLSQEIEFVPPFQWLTHKREEANYNKPRFVEPDAPQWFEWQTENGIRRAVTAYLADTTDLFTFDADHAMVSYPLAMIGVAGVSIKANGGVRLSDEEHQFLRDECRDASGSLAPLLSRFESFMQ